MQYDVIIVGGGTAGLTAALYALRGGLKVLLLEAAAPGGQIVPSPHVENYPALAGVAGADFAQRLLAQVKAAGGAAFTLKYQQAVGLKIADGIKTVQTAKAEYTAPALIWAAGVTPRRLNIPGEEQLLGRGVSFCATCDGPLYRHKTVAVVGGGNTALEEALFLADICEPVHLLHRRDTFRAEQTLVRQVQAKANIKLWFGSSVTAINGANGNLQLAVNTPAGAVELPVAGLFLAVGKQPENSLLAAYTPLDADGYVMAAEDCLTAVPGLFAAGDCRVKPLRQLVTAAADGAVAAAAAINYLK